MCVCVREREREREREAGETLAKVKLFGFGKFLVTRRLLLLVAEEKK